MKLNKSPKEGNPTTDPAAALKGSLVSMGGYKGWGFGLMAELLAAGMTGGSLSRDVVGLKAPEGTPHDLGQYYLLIDPANADYAFNLAVSLDHLKKNELATKYYSEALVLADKGPVGFKEAQIIERLKELTK